MNEPKKRGRPSNAEMAAREAAKAPVSSEAQDFASRVWAAQSETLPRKERLARVAKALEKRGMSMEGVEL